MNDDDEITQRASRNQYILTVKELAALSSTLHDPEIGIRTGTHYINFRAHPNTFTGVELVRWLTNHDIVINQTDAIMVGTQLLAMRRIIKAGGKSMSKVSPSSDNDEYSTPEVFLDERHALYYLAESSYTNQPRRAKQTLKRADSTIFSKSSWSGFKMGRKKLKKKLKNREKIEAVDSAAKKTHKKFSKIVQRRQTMEQFAQGKTALEIAVDQGFDYTEVLVPSHVPIYGTSDGSVYRENATNEDDPPKYQFHYDIAATRKSSTRSSANIKVPKSNKKMSNRVLFLMMGETDRAKIHMKASRVRKQEGQQEGKEQFRKETHQSQLRRGSTFFYKGHDLHLDIPEEIHQHDMHKQIELEKLVERAHSIVQNS
jgi:hypothetical protein